MTLKKKVSTAALWNAIDRLGGQLGGFVILLYLANILGPKSFGLIGMLSIFLLLADNIANSGFFQALVQKNKDASAFDFSTVFWVNFFISSALYGTLFVCAPFIASFYKEPLLIDLSRVLFCNIIINALSVVPKAQLTIKMDFKRIAYANTMAVLFSSVVAIVSIHFDAGYWALAWLNISKNIVFTLSVFYYARWMPSLLFHFRSFYTLFAFGSKLLFASLVSTLVTNLYAVLIGRFFKLEQVGFFTQSSNFVGVLANSLISVLQGVTFPVLSSVKEDSVRMSKIYEKIIAVTMCIALPCMIGFAAIGDVFVSLFLGGEWLPMVPILIALSIARVVAPISALNMNLVNAIGRSDLFLKVELLKLPMTLLILFCTIPFGINVVAYGMVATSFIAFFINAYYPGKFYGFSGWVQLKMMAPMILAAAGMYASVAFIHFDSLYLLLICKVLVGGLVYTGLCYLLRVPAFFDLLAIIKGSVNKSV